MKTDNTYGLNITELVKQIKDFLGGRGFCGPFLLAGDDRSEDRRKDQGPLSIRRVRLIPFPLFFPHLSLLNRSAWRTEAQANQSEYQEICPALLTCLPSLSSQSPRWSESSTETKVNHSSLNPYSVYGGVFFFLILLFNFFLIINMII